MAEMSQGINLSTKYFWSCTQNTLLGIIGSIRVDF